METKKVVLFCDELGIKSFLKVVPINNIVAVVVASNRLNVIQRVKLILKNHSDLEVIIQPKYKSEDYNDFIKSIEKLDTKLMLCYSYSMLVRDDVLSIFDYNCINLHGALLPKNRGANPVQWALIRGEIITGATLHYMNTLIDQGDIIAQKEVKIAFEDTWVSLFEKICIASEELLKEKIKDILTNNIIGIKQNENDSTTNTRLTQEYPKINFQEMSDLEIYNLIRAQVAPLKGAYVEKNKIRTYYDNMISMENIKQLRQKYEK